MMLLLRNVPDEEEKASGSPQKQRENLRYKKAPCVPARDAESSALVCADQITGP
jgi:hypothetical protein